MAGNKPTGGKSRVLGWVQLTQAFAIAWALAGGETRLVAQPPSLPPGPGIPSGSERAPAPKALSGPARALDPRNADAGPQKTIVGDVIIQGNRHVPTQSILNQLQTKPGQPFSAHSVEEDVRKLMATKQFATVDPRLENQAGNKVLVYFLIRDYPSVVQSVEYRGAKHLKDSELETITMIARGKPMSPVANKLACQAIIRRYQEMGRPFASCELLKGHEPGDTEVIFNITEGPIVRVGGVAFEGQSFVTGPVLKTHVQTSKALLGTFGGKFNSAMADNDVLKLEEYYRSHGFLDVKVSRELRYTADGKEVELVFHINEGLRYHIHGAPQVVNAKSVPPEQLEQLSKVKAGEFFSEAKINADKRSIEDYIGYMGREARVNPQPVYVQEAPGLVRLQYEVSERQPARVGQVLVVGNERTKQNVILRQVPLYPGQVLTYPDLRAAERNLTRLNIFEANENVHPTVTVLDPENESDYKDILVQVQETTTGSLLFGVGVNSDAGLNGSIVLNERNFDITRLPTSFEDLITGNAFRGGGQEFRAEAVPGTQLQRYSVSWREPFLFDSQWSLGANAFYFTRQYNEYEENRYGGKIPLGRRLNQYWSFNTSVRVENVGVFNVQPWEPSAYTSVEGYNFQTGIRGGFVRDSRDSLLRPTEGSLLDFGYEQMFGAYTFPLFNAEFNKYFTTYQRADGSGRHVLAFRTQFSWAGDETPVYERFFAGGFRSIRGFQYRGVGPNENGYMVGGDFMWLNSLEYQIPVMANDNAYLVGFVDSGTVEPNISDISTYRVSAGVGLRLVVPMMGPVPIALDFGFPIVKAETDRTQIFNFWMGFFR